MTRTIAWATLIAGTLDILSAFVWSGAVIGVLRTVASGPFGDAIADLAGAADYDSHDMIPAPANNFTIGIAAPLQAQRFDLAVQRTALHAHELCRL